MFERFTMFGTNDDPPETEKESTPDSTDEQPDQAADDPTDAAPRTEELDVRLSELEEELEQNESSIRAVQSSQEEMAETVKEVNDTVRQLLGIYDDLTASKNPFVDDESATRANGHAVGDDTDGGDDTTGGDGENESVVSFEDLAAQEDTNGEAKEAEKTGADEFLFENTGDESAEPDDARDRKTEAANVDEPTTTPDPRRDIPERPRDDASPMLTSVPEGYAGDALLMEWLSMLVEQSGPAGALRAIDYYHDVGWISREVRDRLVDVLGGPELDVHVDPNQPVEPTAAEHAESYEFIRTIHTLTNV